MDFGGSFGFADLVNSTHGVCWFVVCCSISSGLGEQVQPTGGGPFRLINAVDVKAVFNLTYCKALCGGFAGSRNPCVDAFLGSLSTVF